MPSASNPHELLSPAARALLALLRPGGATAAAIGIADVPAIVREQMVELALRHGVAPLLHRALQSGGALARLPDRERIRLEQIRRATALDNLRNYGQFRRIARALAQQGIPVIALKGLHLAELVYRDISLRPMADLDILVPESMVKPAVVALQALEFELNGGMPTGYDTALIHRRLGIMVELHWRLAQPDEPQCPPIDDIWRLAVAARLAGTDAQVMSPEFLILYLSAHLAFHHLFALDFRALCDVAEIAHTCPSIDWSVVVEQGRRPGLGRGIGASLRLARDLVGAAVPQDAIAALGADALDPELFDDAAEQLATFAGYSFELRTAPNLMAFKSQIGWSAKTALLWKRIFVPRAELAAIYGVPERSARAYLYYAVRLRDLVRRYAASLRELNVAGPRAAATTARKLRLARWINGGA